MIAPLITTYRRHLATCPHLAKGQHYTMCDCPVWAYGTLPSGQTIRTSLRTTDWLRALRRIEILKRGGEDNSLIDTVTKLSDATKRFLQDGRARKLRGTTLALYGYVFGHLEKFCGANYPLTAIDTAQLDRFRAQRGIMPSTQRKEIGFLRAFFAWCVDRGWISKNPAKRVRLPQVTEIATLPFTNKEVLKLLAACDQISSDDPAETAYVRKRARALLYVLLYSGLRISDVAKLRRDALDPKTRHLTLRVMKTGVALKVLLHGDATQALETLPALNPTYFFWSGQGLEITCVKNLGRTIKRLGKLATVRARPHRFRDTFAVELLSNGTDIRTVQLLLGHESVRTTEKHYAHFVAAHQALLDTAAATLDFQPKTRRPLLVKPLQHARRNR